MIKGVIFDCFGVLYGGSLDEIKSLCPPERVDELVDLNKQSDYGYITHHEYTAALAEIVGVTEQEIIEILNTKHTRNSVLFDYLRSLKPKVKIGLLSNVGRDTIQELFSAEELDELFDGVVLSYEEGMIKPTPQIFLLTALRLDLRPEECVMIDDLMSNCDGARAAGMAAVLHAENRTTIKHVDNLLAGN